MSYYRLYFMDAFSGHIQRFEEFDADDDRAAVALAESHKGPRALELWCSHRKVARLEAVSLASELLAKRRELKAVKAQVEPTMNVSDPQSESRSG